MAILAHLNGRLIAVLATDKEGVWKENCPGGSTFTVKPHDTHRRVFEGENAVSDAEDWINARSGVSSASDSTGALLVREEPTWVNIHLPNATIKAELSVDGDKFCVSACGGLPKGLVAFGETAYGACEKFRRAFVNQSVKDFGQEL